MSKHFGAGREFACVLRQLRKRVPLEVAVEVRTRVFDASEESSAHAIPFVRGREEKICYFLIEIDRKLSDVRAADYLVHEWAHCMDMLRNGLPRKAHRQSWGVCYAICYDAVYDR